MANPTLN